MRRVYASVLTWVGTSGVVAAARGRFVFSETRTFGYEPGAWRSVRCTIIEGCEKGRLGIFDLACDVTRSKDSYLLEPALGLELVGSIPRTRLTAAERDEFGREAVAYEFEVAETRRT